MGGMKEYIVREDVIQHPAIDTGTNMVVLQKKRVKTKNTIPIGTVHIFLLVFRNGFVKTKKIMVGTKQFSGWLINREYYTVVTHLLI